MTTIRRVAPALGACGLICLLAACGGAADVDATHATLEPVRGTTTLADGNVAPVARVGNGQRIVVPEAGVARLALDDGPRVLLGGGARAMLIATDGSLRLDGGRAYADVRAGDTLSIVTPNATLRTNDGSLSVECTDATCSALRAYVVRGEASWVTPAHRGRVRAGEALTIPASGAPTTAPETLWADWTGGLARPGPSTGQSARGVGTLEGRVPGEEGLARWPLVVRRLDVRVAIHDDLAITEVDETFFNPASDTVEGLYRFHTPEGAVLQRFAVDRDGVLVDGYVREKAQAAAAYQAQVYVGSTDDPALLEWSAPGSFQAKIYPIQPGATRRIVVRYAEWLSRPAAGAPRLYRYPMAAEGDSRQLPIDELSIDADLSDAGRDLHVRAGLGATVEEGRVTLRQSSVVPRADFWMEIEGGDEQSLHAYRADHEPPHRAPGSRAVVNEADERDYWFVPVVLPASLAGADDAARADHGMDLVIVADVSAATDASHLELGRSVAESLVAHLGAHDRVAIVTSDLSLHALGGEQHPQLGAVSVERVSRLLDDLARQPSGGATDLGAAIGEAAALLDPARSGAVVYIGDGAPTVGELGADGLLTVMSRLPQPVRLYAVAVGDNANLDLLETLSRGGGLAQRVVDRAGGAEAAMRILAHAARPLAQRVTVDLGTGIDNAFPRRPVDVVIGDVLSVVGRVRDDVPAQITVHGIVHGHPFTETLAVTTKKSDDATDLRLRWAGERLRQLLIDGAGREAIAELGTRYGLITPYTSYYVPSARELAQMGQSALNFEFHPLPVLASRDEAMPSWALVALGPLALAGCGSDEPGKTGAPASSSSPLGWLNPNNATRDQTEGEPSQHNGEEGQMGRGENERRTATRYGVQDRAAAGPTTTTTPTTDTPMAAPPAMPSGAFAAEEPVVAAQPAPMLPPTPSDPAAGSTATGTDSTGILGALQGDQVGGNFGAGGLGVAGTGRGGGGSGEGTIGLGNLGTIGHGGDDGDGRFRGREQGGENDDGSYRGPAMHHARPSPDEASARIEHHEGGGYYDHDRNGEGTRVAQRELALDGRDNIDALLRGGAVTGNAANVLAEAAGDGGGRGYRTSITTTFTLTASTVPHVVKRCSDAASLSLDDRRTLWSERLARVSGDTSGIADVYRNALRDCEIGGWADRRALLELLLNAVGGVPAMVQLYRVLDDGSARGYLRSAILRRVHTPEDLRAVREAFGLDQGVDWTLVEQVLARQTTPQARIRTLRQLLLQYPDSFDLKLRLLSELEGQHRLPEAKRLAEAMRADPLADAGVRTAIGEMYVRLGDEGEAKRVFSEIVEMAPLDELARRRLGDLYRAHGWFEDAYRQYQTLAQIRPDDPTVSLLLAQAAAGAGRVDEALRLEQRIVETAEPGATDGLARTALLWSSVRFAQLRKAARDEHDQAKLDALISRMRRSGVLRAAGALRVSLTWSHPDAQLSLWASYPGLPLARPTDIAPELGIEALDVQDDESGTYKIEVRRTTADTRTAVDAQVVVVWHEGQADEQISVTPLHFGQGQLAFAWTITGRTLSSSTPSVPAMAPAPNPSPHPAPAVPEGVRQGLPPTGVHPNRVHPIGGQQ